MGNLYTDLLQVGAAMLILIGIGWALQKLKIMTAAEFGCLNKLCSKVGLPFLMFSTFVKQSIRNMSWWSLLITSMVNASVHIILCLSFIIWRENGLEKYVTLQISTCYVNYIIIGLPIFTSIWGEESSKIIVICPFFHYFFVVPLYMLLTNIAKIKKEKESLNQKDDGKKYVYHLTCKDIALAFWNSIKTPLLVGAFLGLIWAATGIKAPIFVIRVSKYIGDFVVVFSLLCIGSFLEKNSIVACEWTTLVICIVIRFVISPLLGIGFSKALKIQGTLGRQCSILSTMPLSTVAYILATSTGYGQAATSSVVFWTVILVIPSIIFWFWFIDKLELFPE